MIDYSRLWTILDEKQMKDRDLARMAGVSVATISRMRKGNMISAATLYQISRVVGCTMDEIFCISQ